MEFYNFRGARFTMLTDKDGKPWWVAKELFNYLERCRDTLIRLVGSQIEKWQLFSVTAKVTI